MGARDRGGGSGELGFIGGQSFSLEDKKVLGMDGGDACTKI